MVLVCCKVFSTPRECLVLTLNLRRRNHKIFSALLLPQNTAFMHCVVPVTNVRSPLQPYSKSHLTFSHTIIVAALKSCLHEDKTMRIVFKPLRSEQKQNLQASFENCVHNVANCRQICAEIGLTKKFAQMENKPEIFADTFPTAQVNQYLQSGAGIGDRLKKVWFVSF